MMPPTKPECRLRFRDSFANHEIAKTQAVARPFLAFAMVVLLLSANIRAESTSPVFKQALGPREWSFPRDHGRHDGFKTEWWYFTGTVHDSGGRVFGYQLTIFRTAFVPQAATRPSPWAMKDIYFGHAAVSDIAGNRFLFKDRLERGRPELAWASDHAMDVRLLDWTAIEESNGTHLRANEGTFAIDLICSPGRGPVLEGPGGVNAKGRSPGQASYYYSMTRLPTAGTLTIDGRAFRVEGLSWMDHEFSSNALAKNQVGWDWMGLHLTEGNDLMVYRLRDASGASDFLSATLIAPGREPRYLPAPDIQLEGSEPWKSPSGGAYPQVWKLRCTGLPPLVVKSRMPGQELLTGDSSHVSYFEGAAAVTDEAGHPAGEGYLEMTGYAKSLSE